MCVCVCGGHGRSGPSTCHDVFVRRWHVKEILCTRPIDDNNLWSPSQIISSFSCHFGCHGEEETLTDAAAPKNSATGRRHGPCVGTMENTSSSYDTNTSITGGSINIAPRCRKELWHWCDGLGCTVVMLLYRRLAEARADFKTLSSLLSDRTVWLSKWFRARIVLGKKELSVCIVLVLQCGTV